MLLDVALEREPFFEVSKASMDFAEGADEPVCIAWHTVANAYYIADQHGVDARDFLVRLTQWVEIAPTDAESVRYAAGLPMADFEDALQVAAAQACDARYIVTRNVRDFADSPIRAIGPREALSSLS